MSGPRELGVTALPEVECPGCGATIRARLADAPGQLEPYAVEAAARAARDAADNWLSAWGEIPEYQRDDWRTRTRAVLETYYRALAAGPAEPVDQ